MGVFDEVRCKYKLPHAEAQDLLFQTKDTDFPYLELYEIREDGTLWHEAYDSRLEINPDAPLGMYQHRENHRWEQVKHEGEFRIDGEKDGTWYRYQFWFRDGVVADVIARTGKHSTE